MTIVLSATSKITFCIYEDKHQAAPQVHPANSYSQISSRGQSTAAHYLAFEPLYATWKRGNDAKSPLQESVHQRARLSRSFAANYAREIAAKFVMYPRAVCGASLRPLQATRACTVRRRGRRTNRFFFFFPALLAPFSLLIVESARDYALPRNCIEPAFGERETFTE